MEALIMHACCRYPGLLMTCYYFSLMWCSLERVFQVRLVGCI